MVGFSMKIKKDEIQKKRTGGAFALKDRTVVPKKILSNVVHEDNDGQVEKISIETSDDLKPEQPKELIIDIKPNKSLISIRKEEVDLPTGQKLSFGLNVLDTKTASITRESTLKQSKESVATNEDEPSSPRNNSKLALGEKGLGNVVDDDEPNYSKISVDDFGLLFLKGLGYKPEDEKVAKDTKNSKRKKYGNQMGLGSDVSS